MSPERPLAPKSYCAAVGIFACALLTPYKPSLTIEKKPGSAFCVGMSPERPLAPKSYCAAVGIFACALLTPYKPSLTTEKKPGSAFCVAKPPKKPLAAESYRGAVGICWVGLACHSRCPNLQPPPSWSKGPVASWMRRRASGFNPGVFQKCRGSNPPSRGCLRLSFCLGSCRAFKGQSKKRRRSPKVSDCSPANRERELGLDPPFKTSFPYKLVFTGQSLSNLLSPCSRL